MSRNFELLDRLERRQLLAPLGMPTPVRAPLSSLVKKEGFPLEEITRLVQRLFLAGGGAGAPGIVSFCGIADSGRSSWICARAAEYLASRADASVCLVDADFRSPRLHTHFGVKNQAGFGAALAEKGPVRRVVTSVASTNLWLIPSGAMRPGLNALRERFCFRLAELRREFDYIFVSAPAMSSEAEAVQLGQLADGMVLIVESNQTGRRSVRLLRARLLAAEVNVMDTVLDLPKFPIPGFVYRML